MKSVCVAAFVLFLAVMALAFERDHRRDEYRRSCEERGGQAIFLENDQRLCIDKGALR